MDSYEIKKSRMTADEIQREIDLIRLAYIRRGMDPMNEYKRTPAVVGWVMVGTAITLIVAAFIVL